MTSAQVVETSVNVISNSPSQDYTHPDDRTLLYDMTPGFKPFTILMNKRLSNIIILMSILVYDYRTCLISAFFLGTPAAQAVAADDVIVQCPTGVSESVCQFTPTAIQQHFEEGAVTLGRGQGKISGKRIMYAGVAWYKYNRQV